MRKHLAAAAAGAVLAVSLVGCSSSTDAASCERPASAERSALDLVTVTGEFGSVPEVEAYTPVRAETTQWEDLVEGTGEAIVADNQVVALDVALYDTQTGDLVLNTPFDPDTETAMPLSRWVQAFPGMAEALEGACEGSRVAMVVAPDGLDPAALASIGIQEGDSLIMVADLRRVYLPKAEGDDQFVIGAGMPSVVRAPDGRPGVIIPRTAAPDDLRIEVLKRGDGPVVDGSQPVRVAYTGLTWAERTVFDSTWTGEPVSLTLDGVVPGFAAALEGQTVGSQILVSIPPDQGYGDQAQGQIPAGSTLVFVIDILGLDAVAG